MRSPEPDTQFGADVINEWPLTKTKTTWLETKKTITKTKPIGSRPRLELHN